MRFLTGRRWAWISIVVAVVVALGMTMTNTALVSAVGPEVKAFRVEPDQLTAAINDPLNPLWSKTEEAQASMTAQQFIQPGGSGTVKQVRVRSMHDMQRIAVRIDWDDTTKDDGSVPGTFTDAAAMQWPMVADAKPFQCMGQEDSFVNIWEWKYAWDMSHEQNVRNYRSTGPGKHIEVEGVTPEAHATYQDNKWYVVYSRATQSTPGTVSAMINPGSNTNLAVAIWNGSAGDNRMQKQVTSWVPATISPVYLGQESQPNLFSQILPFIQTLAFLVAAVLLTLLLLRLVRPAQEAPKPAGPQTGHARKKV